MPPREGLPAAPVCCTGARGRVRFRSGGGTHGVAGRARRRAGGVDPPVPLMPRAGRSQPRGGLLRLPHRGRATRLPERLSESKQERRRFPPPSRRYRRVACGRTRGRWPRLNYVRKVLTPRTPKRRGSKRLSYVLVAKREQEKPNDPRGQGTGPAPPPLPPRRGARQRHRCLPGGRHLAPALLPAPEDLWCGGSARARDGTLGRVRNSFSKREEWSPSGRVRRSRSS